VNQITRAWADKFKANGDNELKRKAGKQSKRLSWFFCRKFSWDCWGRRSCFKFPLAPSTCLSRSISFLFLYFYFFCLFLCFVFKKKNLYTLSRPVSSLVFLRSVLVKESLFLVWEFSR
jgi:hypothetical protein